MRTNGNRDFSEALKISATKFSNNSKIPKKYALRQKFKQSLHRLSTRKL